MTPNLLSARSLTLEPYEPSLPSLRGVPSSAYARRRYEASSKPEYSSPYGREGAKMAAAIYRTAIAPMSKNADKTGTNRIMIFAIFGYRFGVGNPDGKHRRSQLTLASLQGPYNG
jgi:hypothetical protein